MFNKNVQTIAARLMYCEKEIYSYKNDSNSNSLEIGVETVLVEPRHASLFIDGRTVAPRRKLMKNNVNNFKCRM